MKRVLLSAAVAALMIASAAAQTVQIKTTKGETKIYNLSQIESLTFSDEANQEPLVTLEVVNASAYSFDIKATKAASCQKYMVAVYHQNIYRESSFVESAEQTLAENPYYCPFAETLRYGSATFSEAQLGVNSLTEDDGSAAQLIAAVYAVDDLGESKVYTTPFTVPATPVVESKEKATITINESTLTYNHIDYSIACGWNTAKIIYAVTQPSYIDSKLTPAKWAAMSLAEQKAKLLSVFQGIPSAYKSGLKGSYDCSANSTCIVYAIPIDKDGKIGEMDVKTVNTGAPVLDGAGAFTSLTVEPQTAHDNITFHVAVDEKAVAYRLMWFTETDEKNSDYIGRIAEIFLDSKYGDYNTWREFSCEETAPQLNVFRPGNKYYLYGVTVDRFGHLSQPVDLLQTYLGQKLLETMNKPAEEE
ncbi:MAG: hypothetical protein HUK02_06215 [Bacteroidaceae bacterium]|nr:hypothetical protein [Bacteroidaceae bacterium]